MSKFSRLLSSRLKIANKSKSGHKNGPQEVSALNLTIKKVEVHIAYQGDPGEIPEMTPGQKIKPTQAVSTKR